MTEGERICIAVLLGLALAYLAINGYVIFMDRAFGKLLTW